MGIREELIEGCNNSWLIEIKVFKEFIRLYYFLIINDKYFLLNFQAVGYLKFNMLFINQPKIKGQSIKQYSSKIKIGFDYYYYLYDPLKNFGYFQSRPFSVP